MKRRKQPKKKQRTQVLYATTKGDVTEISVSVGPNGDIRFGGPMVDARLETYYDRPRKPKIVHRISIDDDRMYLDSDKGLFANYDRIFAVDTNTREIKGHRVSVTAVVEVHPVRPDGNMPLEPLFFLEFLDVEAKPEQLGWIITAKNIVKADRYLPFKRIALVVDSDESNIKAYNVRTLPVYRRQFLPERVTLVYATTDTGNEYLVNAAIKHADYTGRSILDSIDNGRIPMNEQRVPAGRGYAAVRVVTVQKSDEKIKGDQPDLSYYHLTFTPHTG